MLTKTINQNSADRFLKWIDMADKIVITTHVSPDGDAIGSALGLWHFLRARGKDVFVVVPNSFPDFFNWMPGISDIIVYDKNRDLADDMLAKADVICCLDYNLPSRTADMEQSLVASSARKILIDHHLHPSDFCNIVVSHPDMSSTCEVLFRFICALGAWGEVSSEIATCIYTGMMTDTGCFSYNSNNPEIFFIISQLLSRGIDKDKIYRQVFYTQSESRMRLIGYALSQKMSVLYDFASAVIILNRDELAKYSYSKGDTEGLVNEPLSIKGIKLSVFLREDADMIKVSSRSVGDFPCNEVMAKYFGGGGHLNAAGGEFYGTLEEAEETLKKALVDFQEKLLAAHL